MPLFRTVMLRDGYHELLYACMNSKKAMNKLIVIHLNMHELCEFSIQA